MRASPKLRALRHDSDESGVIVALILNPFLQHTQPVALSSGETRDRGAREISTLGDLARGPARVERLARLDPPVRLEETIALDESNRMTRGAAQSIERRAFGSEQAVTHGNERLADDSQIRMRGESGPSRLNLPDRGVLDGNHARVGVAFVNGVHGASECWDWYRFDRVPPYLRDRVLGVGAPISLKCNAHRQAPGVRLTRRVRSRTVPVQLLRFQHDCPDGGQRMGCRSSSGSLKREGPRDWRRPGVFVSCVYSTARATGAPIGCRRRSRNSRSR